jgi:hypothetical protein
VIRALSTVAVLTAGALPVSAAPGAAGAAIRTDRGCYRVGQKVKIAGSGFASSRRFDVAVDGIDFGESTTNVAGAFSSSLVPGGLGAGLAEYVHHLNATDGTLSADARFTVTRAAGARFLSTSGNPHTLRAPFEVWGFSLAGTRRSIYLHYVAPSGRPGRSYGLGTAAGQCGYLRTRARRVFPFSPAVGTWTLQVDTSRRYLKRPKGPSTRIRVQIR